MCKLSLCVRKFKTMEIIEQPDDKLGYLLTQVSFLKQRTVNAALRGLDITYIQFVILAATLELGAEGALVSQQMISDERRLDKAMVSNVVKTLVDKGLVLRREHPSDRRAFTLELTEAGRDKAIKGRETAGRVDAVFFEGIDKDAFREMLARLLRDKPITR